MTTEAIIIAATGTGGHVFPALSIAEKLYQLNYQIEWFGSDNSMEIEILANKPYGSHQFAFYGVRKKGLLAWFKMPYQLLRNILLVRKKLKFLTQSATIKHAIVMGGYISVPVALAAKSLGINIVLHEQNTIPGLANKAISLFADKICEGFEGAFQDTLIGRFKPTKIYVTGNPVRQSILQLQRKQRSEKKPLQILVLGGSLGAQKLNKVVPKSILELQKRMPKITVARTIHQCGKNRQQALQNDYNALKLKATAMDFIDNIADIYQKTDLIITRSGASTVAEIYALGIPAVLVPYPHAVDNHQYFNALWLKERQTCIIVEDKNLTTQSLLQALETLIKNKTAPNTVSHNNATDEIVKCLTGITN